MGEYTVHLVGESQYQKDIALLREGQVVRLEHEPTNKYDKRAIKAVDAEGCTLGYIERDHWVTRAMLKDKVDVFAVVQTLMGGTKGKRMIGVVLTVWTAADAELQRETYRRDRTASPGGCFSMLAMLLVAAEMGSRFAT